MAGSNSSRAGRHPEVALLIETSNSYCRELLLGIHDYLCAHEGWAVYLAEHGRGAHAAGFADWQGDGIIARIDTPATEAAVRAKRLPTVNVSGSELAREFPAVIADGAALGRLAAAHLLERGLRHFAYCGDCRFAWAQDYQQHFVAALRRAGHGCALFDSQLRDAASWAGERRRLTHWIAALPKPVGIMACYDLRGQQVLDICRQLDLRVPDEVAVLGQHNDEIVCDFCHPPLSSVQPNARLAGFQAAALLDSMMRGRRAGALTVKIPPLGVIPRQSTDVVAVADPQLAAAVRFMRDHACNGIDVSDVLRAVPMSRTAFERKFRHHFGHAPYAAILQVRLQRARLLLSTTRLPVTEVSAQAGFSSGEQLAVAFKKHGWPSPRTFRAHQGQAGR